MSSRAGDEPEFHTGGWAAQYALLLGIQPHTERILFSKIVAALQLGLPQGWSHQVDDANRCYFWNSLTGDSDWYHPDHSLYTSVIDLHRQSLGAPNPETVLREAIVEQEAELAVALEHWTGPYYTEDGAAYWHDTQTGVSVWQDPRLEVARCHTLRSDLLHSLSNEVNKKGQAVETIQRHARGWLVRKRFCRRGHSARSPVSQRFKQNAQGALPDPFGNEEVGAGTARSGAGTARSGGGTARSGAGTARSGAGTARSGIGTARSGIDTARSPSQSRRHGTGGMMEEACGHKSRQKPSLEQQHASAGTIQRAYRRCLEKRQLKRRVMIAAKCHQRQRQKKVDAAIDIQSCWRAYLARQQLKKMAADARKKRKHERRARRTRAATTIQKLWRGVMARKLCRSLREQREQERRRKAEERRAKAEARAQAQQAQFDSQFVEVYADEIKRMQAASRIQAWWRSVSKRRGKLKMKQASRWPVLELDMTLQSLSESWVCDTKKAGEASERLRARGLLAQTKSPTGSAVVRPDTRTRRRRAGIDSENVTRCSTAMGNISDSSSLRMPESNERVSANNGRMQGSFLRETRSGSKYSFDALDASLFGMEALSPGGNRHQRARIAPSEFSTPSPAQQFDRSSLRSAGFGSGMHVSHSSPTLRHGILRPETSSYSPPTRHEAAARPISRAAAVEIISPDRGIAARPRVKRPRATTAVERKRDSSGTYPGDDDGLGPALGRWEFSNNWLS